MIIAAFNPKGGAGKTTTAVNLATVLAGTGRTVLLIDLEADLNASISLGVRPADAHPSIAELLLRHERVTGAVRAVTGIDRLHLITGSPSLARMDASLRNAREPERRLADVVRPFASQFDAVILDAPSGYSTLGLGVLSAADELIVPIRAEYLSLESLAQFLGWYRDRHRTPTAAKRAGAQTRSGNGPPHGNLARIAGILLTRVDYRRQATREIVDIIRVHNRRGVFQTEIPDDQRVAEAPSHGLPLVAYAPAARASHAYRRLARELMTRVQAR